MKSVLCFIDNLGSGGAQRQLVNIAKMLNGDEYNIEFLVYFDSPFYEQTLLDSGIKITKILENNKVPRVVKLANYLLHSSADCVISFLDTPNFISNIAYCFPHTWKLLTNELSAEEISFASKKGRLMRLFRKKTDALICNSYNAMDMWKRHYPDMQHLLTVIYNPLIINDDITAGELWLDDAGSKDVKRLLVAASFQELKGSKRLVDAIHLLSEDYRSRIRVDWYGKNEISPGNSMVYDQTKEKIREYGLEDTVFLHDATPDIYEYMRSADAIGLFSDFEGLPNAICEALFFAKPIVMTKVSDYSILLGKNNGFLCKSGSPEDIADSLKQLIDCPIKDLKDAGLRGKAIADEMMDCETVYTKWIECINS